MLIAISNGRELENMVRRELLVTPMRNVARWDSFLAPGSCGNARLWALRSATKETAFVERPALCLYRAP